MLFDPAEFAGDAPLARGSALRRWLMRACLAVLLAVGLGAALLLFAPLL
ncbi:hypothetical protein [Pelagibius marinus]|nr:hypothetical protein [Pelagibius marinus]